MNMKTIEDVIIHLLSDTYSAEKQLTRALAKLARATSNEKLSQAFHAHLEETHGQIERIDQVVESESNLKIKRMKCVAMEGLIEEANEVIENTEKNEVRDAALIAAAQKVEHYEIASYGTLATLAEQLGYRKAAKLLKETLEEEKATDIKLTDLALNNHCGDVLLPVYLYGFAGVSGVIWFPRQYSQPDYLLWKTQRQTNQKRGFRFAAGAGDLSLLALLHDGEYPARKL